MRDVYPWLKPYVGTDGTLASYAWPGGYPLMYLDADGMLLCPDCANKDPDEWYTRPIADVGVHWEGPPEQCEDCGQLVASAYGEV